MKRLLLCVFLGLSILSLCLCACSKKEEAKQEKGKIEQMTDEAAEVIVTKIRTPMDRARSVKEQEIDRAQAMDDAIDEALEEK